ncbi:MAG TPA: hypothetical protein RMF84_19635, partial [Polyangiaceae bacterium LLY-WYZ-14_1]|nr:hypothetical protein [Polyangiaceae bacterium LLY-WYZ-14_1]
ALAAPALVFAETRSLGRRRVRLRGRVVRVTEGAVTRGAPVEATGTETRIARALERAVRGLVEGPLPCTIHLRPDEDLSPDHLQVAWDDEPDGAFLSPLFLEPGAHRVEARAPGREASALEVTCEAGRVYALDLR